MPQYQLRFLAAFLASVLAAGFTTAGIFTVSARNRWLERNVALFKSFAAGVLVATAFIHIFPHALEMNSAAPIYMLAGFVTIYVANRLLRLYASRREGDARRYKGIVPALGIGFHSLVDGIIYAVTFSVSIFIGSLAAVGMILHEIPEGIITYLLLHQSGLSVKRARLYALGLAALTTPLGLLVAYPFVAAITGGALGALLAMAGGVLVYVGATHLLPEVEESSVPVALLVFAGGVLIAVLGLLFEG